MDQVKNERGNPKIVNIMYHFKRLKNSKFLALGLFYLKGYNFNLKNISISLRSLKGKRFLAEEFVIIVL